MNLHHLFLRPIGLILFLAGSILSAQESVDQMWEPDRPNAIAAKVEGKIITFEQVRREMEPLLRQVSRISSNEQEYNANLNRLQRDVLQNLIDQILIVENFHTKGMTIPKSYIEGEFNDVIQEDFNGERDRFLTYLRSQDQTVRDFRDDLKDKIIVQVMKQQMRRNQAEISPQMIKEFYEENQAQFQRGKEVKLFQISLTPSSEGETVEEKTATVEEMLADGTSFQEVARKMSMDGLARRGGSLGWVGSSDLRRELSDVVFALPEGAVSDPVSFQKSIFFFYVEKIREPGPIPLAEVRGTIEEMLSDQIAREAQENWLQRLREKAYIEYFI
ncbi:peptidylprolyl isomerase [Puniceicoccus vermicola]|uniref:Peptidyl-prolyl cis-trans isomerase n=1 Tax=Puniceicoccus vermicola TaxID=388746 RepID=A0A7X1B211_9BACT|nr:peptidyl-prolyl cis-trans isomerase [Puniceicoccus vermicola]MBC2604169.1 peptidyl-prolyl cis-trans isomerase [Puniceicoccus vermicola]